MNKIVLLGKLRSRPFDMECYRVMFDAMNAGEHELGLFIGLTNLFPDADMSKASARDMSEAFGSLTLLFHGVKASGKQKSMAVMPKGHPVRRLYRDMLMAGIPPGVLDKQDPEFLFQILTEEYGEGVAAADVPAAFMPFLGMR